MENQEPKKHGGPRPGSGRKRNSEIKQRQCAAFKLLSKTEEKTLWLSFLRSTDQNIALKAFLAWNERTYGKVAQPVDVEGELTLVIDI